MEPAEEEGSRLLREALILLGVTFFSSVFIESSFAFSVRKFRLLSKRYKSGSK